MVSYTPSIPQHDIGSYLGLLRTNTHTCIHIYIYICTRICIYTYIHVRIDGDMYICEQVQTQISVYAHTQKQI